MRSLVRPVLLTGLLILSARVASATITFTPSSPNVEQGVNFTSTTAPLSSGVTWTFGDGQSVVSGRTVSHVYKNAGTYTVRATWLSGLDQGTITIVERRYIDFDPPAPRVKQEVTFWARHFLLSTVVWNFGDGTIVSESTTAKHAYKKAGAYTVRAIDFAGKSTALITKVVTVGQANPQIAFTPREPRVHATIEFTAIDFLSPSLIRWDFGDGAVVNDTSPPAITHAYNSPGTYLVRAYDNGGVAVTASASVVVLPAPLIVYAPADPRPGAPVTFNAVYFLSPSLIRWDFGDGTVENDTTPPSITHTYQNPGAYTVRAYDGGAAAATAALFIQVLPPRAIVYSPPQVRTGEPVAFQAVNYISPTITWDFGDGAPPVQGGKEISHTYQSTGMFTVVASDLSGGIPVPVSVSLTIYPAQGPRAKFSISFLELRFEDGTNYRVVPKNSGPLKAFAEMKFEGSGNLYAQWLVDGAPFRLISQALAFAQQTVFDSGEIPGLPTIIPGIHEVTLNIIQPPVEFTVPVIRYFVTAEEAEAGLADLLVSGATRLDRAEIAAASDTVEAPPGDYFLLQGLVKNQGRTALPFVLLRVYLEDKKVDEKLFRDLGPEEERPFESSIHNGSADPKKVYLFLYDLDRKPGRLLFIKEVKIVPSGQK
jgi:PKD repeat protein